MAYSAGAVPYGSAAGAVPTGRMAVGVPVQGGMPWEGEKPESPRCRATVVKTGQTCGGWDNGAGLCAGHVKTAWKNLMAVATGRA